MHIIQAEEDLKRAWDDFVKITAEDGGILQSWLWGDFQKFLDKKIYRFAAIDDNGKIQAVALVIQNIIHFDYNYFYIPRGPVVSKSAHGHIRLLFEEIIKVVREEKGFMLRCDPAWEIGNEKLLTDSGFRKADSEVQPKCSLVIDISKTEQELMAAMKQKTRYNVNLAEKRGVKLQISSEIADIEAFWQLMKQTAQRDGFASHPKEYYKKMFEIFSVDGSIKLFLAQYDGKIVAANLVSFFGRTTTYLHGASSDMYRGVMATYFLQWQAILESKKLNSQYFDFGGVNGQTYQNEKWNGITKFKVGFSVGTPAKEFVGTHETILNPVIYSVYKFAKQIRG